MLSAASGASSVGWVSVLMLMRLLGLTHPDAGTKNRRHIPVRAVGLRRTLFESGSTCLAHRKRTLGLFPATVGFSYPGWRTPILRRGYSECCLEIKPSRGGGQGLWGFMTRELRGGSGGGFFGGVDLFEIFIGIFVEGFDAAFAAEANELALVEGVDGFAHTAEFVARNGAGGEGISFGEFGCFGFFFWGFDDLGLRGFRSGGVGGVRERDEAEGEQGAS